MRGILANKKFLAVVILVILLFTAYWLNGRSTLKITIINTSGNQAVSYALYNQGSKKTISFQSSSATVKKTVSRASYEVSVIQEQKSYFTVVKTKGFFGKTTLEVNLAEEKGRKFVGNYPGPCMKLVAETLVSYECGELFGNIGLHVPADSDTPTYRVKNPSNPPDGNVESIIDTKEGIVAFVKTNTVSDDSKRSIDVHTAYYLGANLEIKEEVQWPGLAGNKTYSFIRYQDGFIAYSSSYDQVLSFTAASSQPKDITTTTKAGRKNLSGQAFDTRNNAFLVLYSNVTDTKSKKPLSEIVISKNSQPSRHLLFNRGFITARFCGNEKICALEAKNLQVYDVSGKKPKLLFSVSGVNAVENTDRGLVVVRNNEVLGLDIEKREGSIEYSYGDYKLNSMRKDGLGYLLVLTNNRSQKVALYIDQETVSDSIDKKVSELQKMSEVRGFVDINSSSIFITPQLGNATIYNNSLGRYVYDPIIQKTVTQKINAKIDSIGVDRKSYQITIYPE